MSALMCSHPLCCPFKKLLFHFVEPTSSSCTLSRHLWARREFPSCLGIGKDRWWMGESNRHFLMTQGCANHLAILLTCFMLAMVLCCITNPRIWIHGPSFVCYHRQHWLAWPHEGSSSCFVLAAHGQEQYAYLPNRCMLAIQFWSFR